MSTALQAAQAFAELYHGSQKYGEELPYSYHLGCVVNVLKRFGVQDEDILIAGWLHDSLEDTSATMLQLEAAFGRRVADLVHRVTNESGKNRKERHEKTYPKILASDDAITLKLADRIANIEHSVDNDDKDKLKMYKKEYQAFRSKLYKLGEHDVMWRHLDFMLGYDG